MIKLKAVAQEKQQWDVLSEQFILQKLCLFVYRVVRDVLLRKKDGKFNKYAMTIFTGRQGSGKSMSMVEQLEQDRRDYPNVKIMTNFGYVNQDEALTDWQQLIDCRNGDDGIIFAIDEIQNEFDVYAGRNFNLELLKVVTQQRKQGIKIYATSQVFTRVTKPLREQTFEVVECYTLWGRWTFQRCFDADDYNAVIDNPTPDKKLKVQRKWKKNFVQSDSIRRKYDSYAVIKAMTKLVEEEKKKGTARKVVEMA